MSLVKMARESVNQDNGTCGSSSQPYENRIKDSFCYMHPKFNYLTALTNQAFCFKTPES